MGHNDIYSNVFFIKAKTSSENDFNHFTLTLQLAHALPKIYLRLI